MLHHHAWHTDFVTSYELVAWRLEFFMINPETNPQIEQHQDPAKWYLKNSE